MPTINAMSSKIYIFDNSLPLDLLLVMTLHIHTQQFILCFLVGVPHRFRVLYASASQMGQLMY